MYCKTTQKQREKRGEKQDDNTYMLSTSKEATVSQEFERKIFFFFDRWDLKERLISNLSKEKSNKIKSTNNIGFT